MTYNYKQESRKKRLSEAKAALKHTLSGESEDNQTERLSRDELEEARLKFVKENESGGGYALRKAKKQLKDTLDRRKPVRDALLSKAQRDQEQL